LKNKKNVVGLREQRYLMPMFWRELQTVERPTNYFEVFTCKFQLTFILFLVIFENFMNFFRCF